MPYLRIGSEVSSPCRIDELVQRIGTMHHLITMAKMPTNSFGLT